MRILNIIQCTNLGGMEQASLRLMTGLNQRGHHCELLSLNPIGALGPLLAQAGIPATGLPYRGRGGWRTIPMFRLRLKDFSPDALIMTGHNLLAMLALRDVCKGRRLLAIHYHHAGVKPLWQWRLIYAVAARRFQAVTFASDFIRREAERIYPPIARKSHTVRNPLPLPAPPTPSARNTARKALGLPLSSKIIGNAGWLIERKRFDVFLRVARGVARNRSDTCFAIAGDGPERDRLRALAEKLDIADRVFWLGWQQDMAPFYQAIDVLLFNSDWDALGMASLEAMSYGVPVVASVTNGGLQEVMSEANCGYYFSQHNISSLEEAVLNCLSQNGVSLAAKARDRIAELCSPECCTRTVENLRM